MGNCVRELSTEKQAVNDPIHEVSVQIQNPDEQLCVKSGIFKTVNEYDPSQAELADCFTRIHTPADRQRRRDRLTYEMPNYWIINEKSCCSNDSNLHLRSYIYKKIEAVARNRGDIANQLRGMQVVLDKQIEGEKVNLKQGAGQLDILNIKWFAKRQLMHLVVTELVKRPNPAVLWKFRLLISCVINEIKAANSGTSSLPNHGYKLCIFNSHQLLELENHIDSVIEICEFMELELNQSKELPQLALAHDEEWVEVCVTFPKVDIDKDILTHEGTFFSRDCLILNILNTFTVRSLKKETVPFSRKVLELDYGLLTPKEGLFSGMVGSNNGSVLQLKKTISSRSGQYAPQNLSGISLISKKSRNEEALVYILAREEEFEDAGDISEIISLIGGSKVSQGSKFAGVKEVDELMKECQYQKAAEQLKAVASSLKNQKDYRKQTRVCYLLGICYQKMNKFKEALGWHEAAMKLVDDSTVNADISIKLMLLSRCGYAMCLVNLVNKPSLNQSQPALSNLQQASKIVIGCWKWLGAIQSQPRTYCECVRMIAEVMRKVQIGKDPQLKEISKQIMAMLDKAIKIYGMTFNVREEAATTILLADVEYSYGHKEQALLTCNAALTFMLQHTLGSNQRNECSSHAHYILGEIEESDKRYNLAIEHYKQAIKDKPQTYRKDNEIVEICTSRLHFRIGVCYKRQAELLKGLAQENAAAGKSIGELPLAEKATSAVKHLRLAQNQQVEHGEGRFSESCRIERQDAEKFLTDLNIQ